MNEEILDKTIWNEEEIQKRSRRLAEETIKIFPYPNLDEFKIPVNKFDLLNDEILKIKKATPTMLEINNDEIIVSTWTDVYTETLKYIYNKDNTEFLCNVKEMVEEHKFQHTQISEKVDELRDPYKISDGVFIEKNKSTNEKIRFIRNLAKKMDIKDDMVVLYIDERDLI